MKNKRMLKNALSSAIGYGLLLIFSIVSSKFVLIGYGSETNGLISSVNQIFSYIALLEAGIGTATVSALYQPLARQDRDGVCDVLAASRHYYRTATKWYFLCVVAVSFVWPFVLDTEIPYLTIWAVIFFQGVSGVITFWYTSTITNYLLASGRNYININVHMLSSLAAYGLKILICLTDLSIVCISLSLIAVNILKCLFYYFYMRRYCPEYYYTRTPDKKLLKQKNSFLIHEISGVIFSSTDTIILSIFCGLSEASVYAVYALVLNALRTIIGQVFNGTNYILGHSYSEKRDTYYLTHDRYNCFYVCAVFAIFSIAYLLILPFLTIYTRGVTDANYLDVKLPILFVLIELLSACRIVDNQLIKISLHAKQTVSRAMIEAIINLVVSLVLVQFFGIYGVLLGTIVALLYRTNDIIIYTNKNILERSSIKEYVLYGSNFAVFILVILCQNAVQIKASSYFQLIGIAIPVSGGILVLYALVYITTSRYLFRSAN